MPGFIRRHYLGLGLTVLFFLCMVLGMVGFTRYAEQNGGPTDVGYVLYKTFQLFSIESGALEPPVPWTLQIARFLAPVVTITTVLKVISRFFEGFLRTRRIRRYRKHTVICGLGRKGYQLLQDCCMSGRRVIAIEREEDSPFVRSSESLGAVVLRGNAMDPAVLMAAGILHADAVIITTGDDDTNVEIFSGYARCTKEHPAAFRDRRTTCYIHVFRPLIKRLFTEQPLFRDVQQSLDIHVFDVYDNACRIAFRKHLLPSAPVGPDDPRRLQLLIFGFGRMGQALLLHVARTAHFANGMMPKIQVIDRRGGSLKSSFLQRYPQLTHACDVAFHELDVESAEALELVCGAVEDPTCWTSVAFCMDNDYANVSNAFSYQNQLRDSTPGLVFLVRTTQSSSLTDLLTAGRETEVTAGIHAFGRLSECCCLQRVEEGEVESLARELHEGYRALRKLSDPDHFGTRSADKAWHELDHRYRDSSRYAADHIDVKLAAAGYRMIPSEARADGVVIESFDDSVIDMLARMEHARWEAERWVAGWRYTKIRNEQTLSHTDLVGWDQLDESQKKFDVESVAGIPRILMNAGYQVVEDAPGKGRA